MTRKDYKALAETLRQHKRASHQATTQRGYRRDGRADILQHTFQNFDRKKFIEATKP
jgi:hypothetical protein